MKMGQTITELKNKVMGSIVFNERIVRAIVIDRPNFLTATPTPEEQDLIDNPVQLIRTRIFPYIRTLKPTVDNKPYITMQYVNFNKKDKTHYRSGMVYFYVLCPINIEKTDYGIRYDFILDELEKVFSEMGIGELEFGNRNDIAINDESQYIGCSISFNIIDFYGVE